MLHEYKTVQQTAKSEITIKKSKFISFICPAHHSKEAETFIAKIKKQYRTATHYCWAFCIVDGHELQKQSDDGEPTGTAGKPILGVILKQKFKNVVIVVVRYFGGTMLGAGGLIRAYTEAALAAVSAARVITRKLVSEVFVELDYVSYRKVKHKLKKSNVQVQQLNYSDNVQFTCLPLYTEAETFVVWITDITEGQAVITRGRSLY